MISAKIIADSISPTGERMTTMEIEYPRFILAELNTHRMLSKNSASSRAIPVKAMHDFIMNSPATPVYWGKNQAGMKAKEELQASDLSMAKYLWGKAKEDAIHWAKAMADLDLHKQITNRVTEPWMTMKTVISGTEWNNIYWLRDHPDAQPEFGVLAKTMRAAHEASTPILLNPGEWHLPYMVIKRDKRGEIFYRDQEGNELNLEDARIVSASCCAQVSYRKNDDTLEKAHKIYRQLIESTPAHASPVEHQATPMDMDKDPCRWEKVAGITHQDRNGELWSGNLRGWVQFRKLIPNEAKW
jgi:hypothetical protein